MPTAIVDVHGHCTPVAFTDMSERLAPARRGEPYPTYDGAPPPPRSDTAQDIQARLRLMDEASVQVQVLSQPAEPPSVTARRLYYDTVGHGSTVPLWAAWKAFGADHLLAGSDYPVTVFFEPYRANFDYIREAGLPAADVERILSNNALDLFKLPVPR